MHTLIYGKIVENVVQRFSASEKDCSDSYTGTVRAHTKYTLSNQSDISAKFVLYTVCKYIFETN